MEDSGYIGVPNRGILQAMVASFCSRKQISTMKWVKGHNGHQGNEEADRLANEGAWKSDVDSISLEIHPTIRVTGAALNKMTQSRAYKALHERKLRNLQPRPKTARNLEKAMLEGLDVFGEKPTAEALWRLFQHKDIDQGTRYFLWMLTHEAYRVGEKWLHFTPEYHEHAQCEHCGGVLESMEHILTSCTTPGQKEVWDLTKTLLEKRKIPWHSPSMAMIQTCVVPVFKRRNGKCDSGKERFYRIIISSSVQVIWNARCERVIGRQNSPFTPDQIRNRWLKKINKQLELDRLMTYKHFGKKALPKDIVLRTWAGSLQNEHQLPSDWTEASGVLVGMES
ncbi:uncharacterized protein EV420DRAFT_1622933 [Desarmillaria tabescens]|uniref:RNase H type-1 domain-containing protein n=1 Tax=Armillaria tabescens TaxID=1929756 RepID=A0AA39JJG2_ARMTA|nr:uncharacterized protein EV420DRAFT_1622933 [Desarmillaria tabescens]KAK0443025.1 hypothetical protein EV420DRAFT_1622933 [Desarmillaria tabescens]